jgi:predicted nuclease of predicted toxin-antitoxin system
VRFLADESCDFGVVTALRAVGHDVTAVAEINPGSEDESVLRMAYSESRVLLTEDKDFGLLAYAGGQATAGVVLIRFPAGVRAALGQTIADLVHELGDRMTDTFVVVEPGRARISRPTSEWRESTDK